MSPIEAALSAHSGLVDLGVLPSKLDGGVAPRAAIGLVVLASDQTIEHEFRLIMRQPGVAFYEFSRLQRPRDHPRDAARYWPEDRAERGPYPPKHRTRRGCVRLHIRNHDARRRRGLCGNPQGPAVCRLHDPRHGRASGVSGAARKEGRLAHALCARNQRKPRQIFRRPWSRHRRGSDLRQARRS